MTFFSNANNNNIQFDPVQLECSVIRLRKMKLNNPKDMLHHIRILLYKKRQKYINSRGLIALINCSAFSQFDPNKIYMFLSYIHPANPPDRHVYICKVEWALYLTTRETLNYLLHKGDDILGNCHFKLLTYDDGKGKQLYTYYINMGCVEYFVL